MDLLFKYHPAWIILAVVIALAYSFALYRKDGLLAEVKQKVIWLLATFRFIAVFLICLLLIGIILENLVDRKEKPIIFVAHDNSESVLLNADSNFYRTTYPEELRKLSTDLQEDYEVINYAFSDVLTDGIEDSYNGKLTDISQVFDQIFDQYTNRNIGGIILSTDGIYNTGSNPVYAVSRKSFIPIFTVGLGDTSEVKDLKIEAVKHNDIAFLGNQFPVDVILHQTQCQGNQVKVGIYSNDKLVKEKRVSLTKDEEQITVDFVLKANRVGFQKYEVRVEPVEGEFSVKNNVSNFYVEVIDGRQKLLIAHNGPHPDITAFRFIIQDNKNYEVKVSHINDVKNPDQFDLIIVHNYIPQNNELSAVVNSGTVPCLFIVGNRTDINALNTAKVGLSGNRSDVEEVNFSANPNFKDILLSPATTQLLSSAPPLQAPFGNFDFASGINVFAYQKIGNIVLEKPLIYFTQKSNNRIGVIMGEGIWRWRLYDQARNNTTEHYREFISKIITYLAIKDNKDPFRVHIKSEYNESDDVVVKAELYNKSFELINEPEVKFEYTNEAGKTFEPYFVRVSKYYQLNLGKLPQGIYDWKASTNFQGVNYKKEGTFLVRELKLEFLNSQANHRLLMNIAENSGGGFYLPRQLDQLKQDIKAREDLVTVVYQEKSFDDLIDYKWLFFLIVTLLSAEWFIRKYQGSY